MVFFDIGHTLVTGADQSPRRLLGGRLGLSERETRTVGKLIMTHDCDQPAHLAEAIVQALPGADVHGVFSAVEAVWHEQIQCVREIQGAASLLRGLKDAGFGLGVISNIWHPFYTGFRRNCPHLEELLDHSILSYRQGWKKPAEELYRKAAHIACVPTSRCWMVGDTYELDMEPARRVGMGTIWFLHRPEKERPVLVELLRGDLEPPDWVVGGLDEILPFLTGGRAAADLRKTGAARKRTL